MTLVAVPLSDPDPIRLIARSDAARAAGADLVEVRIDLCIQSGGDPQAIIAAIPRLALPVIATIRHSTEFGAWQGRDDARAALYLQAVAAGARWIDIELATWPVMAGLGLHRVLAGKLILSYHDFAGPGDDPAGRIRAMRAAGADICKVAVMARDAADLAGVRGLIDGAGPVAAMAMGEHGLPSRLLAGVWGSALTFARLPDDPGSAPGQPTTADLLDMCRLRRQTAATPVYGVIGSPIAHSLSPLVHNLAFAAAGLDAVYVPVRVEDAPAFWDACGPWFSGLSITIPHKHALQERMDDLEPLCDLIGAMNTIYRKDGGTVGRNTDADAIRQCCEQAAGGPLPGRRALVLGAGGAGRAAVFALKAAGARVAVANRTDARADELAREIGGVRAVPWTAIVGESFDVLVNMTSVGLKAPGDTPWAHPFPAGCGVFDSVYNPLRTRLVRDAEAAGCRTVLGLEMFILQACAQFACWTGRQAPAAAMRAACEARLGG